MPEPALLTAEIQVIQVETLHTKAWHDHVGDVADILHQEPFRPALFDDPQELQHKPIARSWITVAVCVRVVHAGRTADDAIEPAGHAAEILDALIP